MGGKMANKTTIWTTALALFALSSDQVFAGFLRYTPPVPEFDGASSIAAIALLMSVSGVLFDRSRNK